MALPFKISGFIFRITGGCFLLCFSYVSLMLLGLSGYLAGTFTSYQTGISDLPNEGLGRDMHFCPLAFTDDLSIGECDGQVGEGGKFCVMGDDDESLSQFVA